MDTDTIKVILGVVNILLTAALWIFALYNKKHSTTDKAIKDLERSVTERFEAKCVRLSKVEAEIKAFPSREELVRVHQRLDGLMEVIADSAKETNLLLGQLSGQIKQMNQGRRNNDE